MRAIPPPAPRSITGRRPVTKKMPRGADPAIRALIARINQRGEPLQAVAERAGVWIDGWVYDGASGRVDAVRAALNAVGLDLEVVDISSRSPVAVPPPV